MRMAARQPGCGKFLRASSTTIRLETVGYTRGNNLEHGKNDEDWIIRRRVPKPVMIGHGTVSETAKVSVSVEGLISPRMLKVQSVLPTKGGEHHGVVNCCPHSSPLSINGCLRVYATKCSSKIWSKFAYRLD